MNKNAKIPCFSDLKKIIISISKSFSGTSGIDMDEFISLAGERYTICLKKYNPDKAKFITFFLYDYKNYCRVLIRRNNRQKRSVDITMKAIPLDKINDDSSAAMHDIVSCRYKFDHSVFATLSEHAKYFIESFIHISLMLPEEKKQKLFYLANKEIKKQYGKRKQISALNEIAELINGRVSDCKKTEIMTITFAKPAK